MSNFVLFIVLFFALVALIWSGYYIIRYLCRPQHKNPQALTDEDLGLD